MSSKIDKVKQMLNLSMWNFNEQITSELIDVIKQNILFGFVSPPKGGGEIWESLSEGRKKYYKNIPFHMGLYDETVDEHMIDDIISSLVAYGDENEATFQAKVTIGGAHGKTYAKYHEHGAGKLPSRPFARPALRFVKRGAKDKLIQIIKRNVESIDGVTVE